MAQITLKGNPIHTHGELPGIGQSAPDFKLVAQDLSEKSLKDFSGKVLVLNIFPSIDTPVCANSVRRFNQEAASHENVSVLNISRDLPFAQKRFCGAEGIDRVEMLSSFRSCEFGKTYGIRITDGALAGLLGRAIVVIDADGKVAYTELVPEIAQEPNYDAALNAVQAAV